MSNPYSIDDWNELLRAVNLKLQDPPAGAGCQPIDPIDEVSDPHIWSVDDVQTVRDKLIETCPDISFSEPLEIWQQEIINEIDFAMNEAWCDCCDDEFLHEENGLIFELGEYPWETMVADIVPGLQLGKSGIKLRIWKLYLGYIGRVVRDRGGISCEGVATYTGSGRIGDMLGGWKEEHESTRLVILVLSTSGAKCQDCDD